MVGQAGVARFRVGGGRPALSALRTTVVFTSARLRLVSGEASLAELETGAGSDTGT